MLVTVAICTWNRAELLDQTLGQMRQLRIPEGVEWELLVVNNNCTDHTDKVVGRHTDALPIRRLFEPTPGLSHARNRAVAEAKGELIVWTDDDVLVDSWWLSAYVDASRRHPEAGYFGGRIDPWYEVPPPRWIDENRDKFEGMLVIRDFGDLERPFADAEQPWGASMAFRHRVLKGARFDPNLGRCRNDCILGDETALLTILRNRGEQGIWVPMARVRHFIPRSRLTLSYAWTYFQGTGRTQIRIDPPEGVGVIPTFFGAPRWIVRRTLEYGIAAYWRRILFRTDWIGPYLQAAAYSGFILEHRRLAVRATAAD